MKLSDAADMYELNLDPEVIQYTGDVSFDSVEDAYRFLKKYDHYREYGFGRWAVIRKSDQAFLGWCGIKYSPSIDEYDIGYRFMKRYWGNGYATEAASACIDWAFGHLQIDTIVGRSIRENKASSNVLKKLGLTYLKTIKSNKEVLDIYTIKNPTTQSEST